MKRWLVAVVLLAGCGTTDANTPEPLPADFKPGVACIFYPADTAPATTVEGCPGGVMTDFGTFVPAVSTT